MERKENAARTVQEELTRERKFWKQNQLWTLILAAVVILFGVMGGSGVSVATGPETLMLTLHDGNTVTVAYADITSAELLENGDYGVSLAGEENRAGRSGTWQHPQWGSYTLCAYASCDSAVHITAQGRSYVVNLPSEAETQQLYQLILEKLPASR